MAQQTSSTIFLRETIRPTRLAFLLAEPAPNLFLKAAESCTSLWGGVYNPIIVLNQAERVRLGVQEQFGDSTEEEILGTLKDFDPDFLVTLGTDALPPYLARLFRGRHLNETDLSHELRRGQRSGVFLEVWPFLEEFWRDEVRGTPGDVGVRLVSAADSPRLEPFVAAQFGRYEREGVRRMMQERMSAQDAAFNAPFRQAFEFGQFLFPIDFTALSLDALGQAAFVSTALFALDAENIFDIVDYWNLRAAGMTILPLPVGFLRDYSAGVRVFATATKVNMPTHIDGEVIKARGISDELLEEVTRWASETSGLALRHDWYPRFGKKNDLSPEITPVQIAASSSNQVAILENGWGHLVGATPPCKFDGPAYFQQWSSELDSYSDHSDTHIHHLPWLKPECDQLVARHFGRRFGRQASRVSRTGIVCHREGDHGDTSIKEIEIVDVVRALMTNAGFAYGSLSSSGLAAERMVAQLGGMFYSDIFQHRGVRKVFEHLEHGRTLLAQEIRATLNRMDRPGFHQSTAEVMDELVKRKALRAGMEFKCEACGRHDWYHISEFDERFKCKKCFAEQSAPRLETQAWRYRADGLFILDGKMAGCMSVLLSILHIRSWAHRLHYHLSFTYKDGARDDEADFMCFHRGFNNEVDVIVGEAKTFLSLKDYQIARMNDLAKRLDAWLVFSKLEGEFSESDKSHFRDLRDDGRRLILLDGPLLEANYDEIMEFQRNEHPGIRGDLARLSAFSTERIIGPLDPQARAAASVALIRLLVRLQGQREDFDENQ